MIIIRGHLHSTLEWAEALLRAHPVQLDEHVKAYYAFHANDEFSENDIIF